MNRGVPSRVFHRPIFAALIAAATSAASIAQEAPISNPGGRDFQAIAASGILRVAITHFDIPPFHIRRSDGTFAGKDIDFMDKLGGALGTKIVIVDDAPTFDAVVDAIADGRADIGLSKLSETYDRLSKVRFSQPYLTLRHALLFDRLLMSAGGMGISTEQALREFRGRIGVIGNSAYVLFARAAYPLARIVEFPSWEAAVNALRQRQVGMVYRDEFEVRSVLIGDPAMHVEFGAAVMTDRRSFLTIAICDTCVKLHEVINFFIAQNSGDYKLDALLMTRLQH